MAKTSINWALLIGLISAIAVTLIVANFDIALGFAIGAAIAIGSARIFGSRGSSPDGEDANDEKPPISSSETPADGSGETSGGDE